MGGDLDVLLDPASIAIVGASGDRNRIGGRPLHYLTSFGYRGRVYPVNPKYDELQGMRCYPDVASLPGPVDLAVVCLGADLVLPALQTCAEYGVRAAVVFAAGFAESDDEGRRQQRRITELARTSGMRILGPNTVGFRDLERAVFGTFSTDVDSGCRSGPLAIVTQSGGLGVHFGAALPRQAGLGTRYVIDTGNEADVQVAECVEYVSRAGDVAVIGIVLEGCSDGRRFIDACAAARRRGKVVVALKIGRSERGAAAVQSHTGALAGEDAVWDAALRAAGVIRAHDEIEFFDVLAVHGVGRRPAGNRVGIVSLSGGVATLMLDACAEVGLEVPDLPAPPGELLPGIPPGNSNPLDVSANLANNPAIAGPLLRHIAAQEAVDALVVWMAYVPQSPILGPALAEQFIDVARETSKPFALVGLARPDIQQQLVDAGIVVSNYPTRLLRAFAMADSAPEPLPSRRSATGAGDGHHADVGRQPTEVVTGRRAAAILRGVPFAPARTVTSPDQAAAAAADLGYPVVMKAEPEGVAHKTELGLVRLGLANEADVRRAYRDLRASVRNVAAEADVVVQRAYTGAECFAGLSHDPVFGPTVTLGMGGVLVEWDRDVTTLLAPAEPHDVIAAVRSLRGYPRLAGVRGQPRRDVEAFADAVAALSRVPLADPTVVEADCNPIFVDAGGAVAVDAVVVRAHPGPAPTRAGPDPY